MTLDEYQAAAARTTNAKLSETELLLDAAAGLAEESGEILGLVRKTCLSVARAAARRVAGRVG